MAAGDRIKPGRTGRYFEDFAVGDVYKHVLGRTVTATDNSWFTLLTQNTGPCISTRTMQAIRNSTDR